MTLNKEDEKLFYELWFPLLDFVNEKFTVNPHIGKIHGANTSDPNEVKEVANVLWDNVQVIDEYLKSYGTAVSDENRSIIEGWKRRVADDFILERHLKSGSVFISAHTNEVFLVSGIISSWEEIFFYRSPPIMLGAVLIPFRNIIISDGLVLPYNVAFGKGYSSGFKDIYMTTKKSGSIHITL